MFEQCVEGSPASRWASSQIRRSIDLAISLAVLMLSAFPMLLIAAIIRLSSPGPAIFSQERVGRKGRLFRIYKFRSMAEGRAAQEPRLTCAGDHRVTAVGGFLRKFKLDELPQFYNVLRGDMSLVGPRPKLPEYSDLPNMSYPPGITGPATIVFRHEEELMRSVAPHELDRFYLHCVRPVKARLDTCYMCKATPSSDCAILLRTLLSCMRPLVARRTAPANLTPGVANPSGTLRMAREEISSADSA